jgi:AraC-like DNA-binding protein
MTLPQNDSVLLRHAPQAPLSPYVDRLWYSASYSAAHALERILPTASVDLVIRLDQERIRLFDDKGRFQSQIDYGVLIGAHSRPRIIETRQQTSVIGIHFRPAGAALFFSQPLGTLANLAVDARDVWGAGISSLRDQLLEVSSPTKMFQLLETALLDRLNCPSEQSAAIRHAANQFLAAPTYERVKSVRSATGYTPKRFISLFTDYVGLTPKVFCRVLRFQSVLRRIATQPNTDWAAVAANCGYYDQSHLIHDFRDFSGVSPTRYRPVQPDRPNHIALDNACRAIW